VPVLRLRAAPRDHNAGGLEERLGKGRGGAWGVRGRGRREPGQALAQRPLRLGPRPSNPDGSTNQGTRQGQ